MSAIELACPRCNAPAGVMNGAVRPVYRCIVCHQEMPVRDGVLLALPPDRAEFYRTFLNDYTAIRDAEGRGSEDPTFYRSLPFADTTGNNAWQWQIRAKTYQHLISHVL